MEPIEFDGLLTVCALSNNDLIGDGVDEGHETLAHDRLIINHHDFDRVVIHYVLQTSGTLIEYREAVTTSSPGLPPRRGYPEVSKSNPAQPRWGSVLFRAPIPNVAAERQRWAGGRNRFAVSQSD